MRGTVLMTPQEEAKVEAIVVRAVHSVFAEFGLHAQDAHHVRSDLSYLRGSRETSEKVGIATRLAILTAFVSGAATLFWMGLKLAFSGQGGS
jgi:propanediol dehydratase large subunit